MKASPIIIKDDVLIGTHATILASVTIGGGSIVAAIAIVTKDVGPYSVVIGAAALK